MRRKQAGKSLEPPTQANGKYLEHQHCETIREVYQTIHASALNKFSLSVIDSWWKDLNTTVYYLERLPEEAFKEVMEVLQRLKEARNELRHARFLFDVEEIKPVHRLIMRNRAVLRSEAILRKLLSIWPYHSAFERPGA